MPETDGSAFVRFRSAVGLAFAVERAVEIAFRGPLDIIGEDQIEMAVLVVVNPCGAGAEFLWPQQPRLLCDICESAVAVVVKKVTLAVGSNKKIVVAIVVVVPDRHPHSKHIDVQSRLVGCVRERAVMIVVIELGRRVLLNVPGPVHAVHEKNVWPAVIVVVNDGHTRSHGFGKKFLPEGAIVVDEVDSRLLRDIPELNL